MIKRNYDTRNRIVFDFSQVTYVCIRNFYIPKLRKPIVKFGVFLSIILAYGRPKEFDLHVNEA
jgi:hypothetical protein